MPGQIGNSQIRLSLEHLQRMAHAQTQQQIREGLPVFGTCAGLILLAKSVEGGTPCFATMDISVLRNAYGRQLGSFYAEDNMEGVGKVPMTFIRAPYIRSVSASARVLAVVDGSVPMTEEDREVLRLEMSLQAAGEKPILCFLHYPPLYQGYECPEILELLQRYGVRRCFYGHLHGPSHKLATEGIWDGVDYALLAADFINFRPQKILP